MSRRASSAESSTGALNNVPGPNPSQHTCPICSKVFSSTQALGGHQNAHRRERAQQARQRFETLRLLRETTVYPPPPRPQGCNCLCTGACGYFGFEARPRYQRTEVPSGGEETEKPLSLELTMAVGGTESAAPEVLFPVSDFMQTGLDLDLKL